MNYGVQELSSWSDFYAFASSSLLSFVCITSMEERMNALTKLVEQTCQVVAKQKNTPDKPQPNPNNERVYEDRIVRVDVFEFDGIT